MSSSNASPSAPASIDLIGATALGVGGMMGAGLYTLLGLAARSSGVLLPLAFLLAGVAACFSVYSYARLGTAFPSRGGGAHFLLAALGDTDLCASLNVFQYVAYLIATSLYGAGFSEYVGALAGGQLPTVALRLIGAAAVVVFTVVNLVGAQLVDRSQKLIIAAELVILALLLLLGSAHIDPARLTATPWPSGAGVVTAAALLYVTFQGFGVVSNAAQDMRSPKTQLPKAMFMALAIVLVVYLLVSTLVVTLLPLAEIERVAGHVLANAGGAVLGRTGFLVIAAAAILATASAVNATLFASANIGADLASSRQLPGTLARPFLRSANVSLPVSAGIVILLVLFFPLDAVGQMTSLAFLIVYGAVSAAHLRVRGKTGARAWPLLLAVVINAALFVSLLIDTIRTGSPATWITFLAVLAGSFALTTVLRRGR
ncbi:APC family permease [Synechococcus sp. 1G10]|uniref:APC family permease n=1 Tax=Synechococcus sp. 1G10 TaxID=2025605 RepID=UPI000B9867FC|nr:APC family permease [Synechococcus sp. 1G10]